MKILTIYQFLLKFQGVAKQLLFPVLSQFTKAFIHCLQLPDSPTCDSGLKLEIIKVKRCYMIVSATV